MVDSPVSEASGSGASKNLSETPASSKIDYQELFEKVKKLPCRVERLDKAWESSGRKPLRTKRHVIDRELDRVYEAQTLEEIHSALEEAGRNLQQLDIFNNLHMLVHEEPEEDPEAVSVVIDVEEKNWYKLRAATYAQGTETSFELGLGLHNLTGGAEHFTVSGEIGSERSTEFNALFEQPKPFDLPITLTSRLAQSLTNNQKTSSYTEMMRGLALGVKSFDGRHSMEYSLGWRRLDADPSGLASKAVLSQVDDYVKSALKYSWQAGNKVIDEGSGQVSGWALRASSELSGLGYDERLRFAKQGLDWQALLPFTPLVTLSLSASAGVMLPWGEGYESKVTHIADRFFLGGPSSLRGFKHKGVGPVDVRRSPPQGSGSGSGSGPEGGVKLDALGGDLYTSVMASLLFQLPQPALRALRMQGQAFVNGGSCVQLAGSGRPIRESVDSLSKTLRWSAGVGLVLPTVFGRFEANYVMVLSHQEQDKLRRGIQLGFVANSLV